MHDRVHAHHVRIHSKFGHPSSTILAHFVPISGTYMCICPQCYGLSHRFLGGEERLTSAKMLAGLARAPLTLPREKRQPDHQTTDRQRRTRTPLRKTAWLATNAFTEARRGKSQRKSFEKCGKQGARFGCRGAPGPLPRKQCQRAASCESSAEKAKQEHEEDELRRQKRHAQTGQVKIRSPN